MFPRPVSTIWIARLPRRNLLMRPFIAWTTCMGKKQGARGVLPWMTALPPLSAMRALHCRQVVGNRVGPRVCTGRVASQSFGFLLRGGSAALIAAVGGRLVAASPLPPRGYFRAWQTARHYIHALWHALSARRAVQCWQHHQTPSQHQQQHHQQQHVRNCSPERYKEWQHAARPPNILHPGA